MDDALDKDSQDNILRNTCKPPLLQGLGFSADLLSRDHKVFVGG